MWLIAVALALLAGIALHAVVVRVFPGANRPVSFLVVGSVVGIGMIGALASQNGFVSVPVAAAALTYAFACKLYLSLFSSALTSISMNLLVRLLGRPMSDAEIDAIYDTCRMVRLRIERLVSTGLLRPIATGGLEITEGGDRLIRIFARLQNFFRNAPKIIGK